MDLCGRCTGPRGCAVVFLNIQAWPVATIHLSLPQSSIAGASISRNSMHCHKVNSWLLTSKPETIAMRSNYQLLLPYITFNPSQKQLLCRKTVQASGYCFSSHKDSYSGTSHARLGAKSPLAHNQNTQDATPDHHSDPQRNFCPEGDKALYSTGTPNHVAQGIIPACRP